MPFCFFNIDNFCKYLGHIVTTCLVLTEMHLLLFFKQNLYFAYLFDINYQHKQTNKNTSPLTNPLQLHGLPFKTRPEIK